MNLNIQDFLLTNSLSSLEENHAVKFTVSNDLTRIQFNYNQIQADDFDPIVKESRGLILKKADNTKVKLSSDGKVDPSQVLGATEIVAFPFVRFYNYGQEAARCNLSDPKLKIFDKLDGTLCICYCFNDNWYIATRKVPDASILIDGEYTFRTLFEKALKETIGISFDEYTSTLDKNYTYMFELTTPLNEVVVKHTKYQVTLLGQRNIKTLEETKFDDITNIAPKVKFFQFSKIEDIVEYVNSTNPSEFEGVVICDSKFQRVKVKSVGYVAAARIKDSVSKSPRALIALILSGKEDDVIGMSTDDIKAKITEAKTKVSALLNQTQRNYSLFVDEVNSQHYSDKVKRKVFASLVTENKVKLSDFYYAKFSNKVDSIEEYINKQKNKAGEFNDSFLDRILESI